MSEYTDKGKIKAMIEDKLSKEGKMKPPLESGFLPPRSIKLDMYHAMEENKLADTDLLIKRLFARSKAKGAMWGWVQLDNRKSELKQLFEDANKGIKENKASTSRFREIIKEKLLSKYDIVLEIENYEIEIDRCKDTYDMMKKYVNEYSVYEKFLESVAQEAPEFNSVGDILNRFETLELTRQECSRVLEEELESASDIRSAMVALVDGKSSQLKNLNNKLIMLHVNKKQAKVRRMYWEHMLQRLKNVISNKEEEKLALKGACWDFYRELCVRRNHPPEAKPDDLDAQLEFIRKTIIFYKEVATIAVSKHVQNAG